MFASVQSVLRFTTTTVAMVVLLLSVASVQADTIAIGANIVDNPGFEINAVGGQPPESWSKDGDGAGGPTSNWGVYGGGNPDNRGTNWSTSTTTTSTMYQLHSVEFTTDTRSLVLSLDFAADAGAHTAGVTVSSGATTLVNFTSNVLTPVSGTTWTHYTYSIPFSPAAATTYDVRVNLNAHSTTSSTALSAAEWDNISLSSSTSSVPEPSAISLLVIGLFGLMAYAWRKRK